MFNTDPSTVDLLNADPNQVVSETLTGFDGLGRATSSAPASYGQPVFTTTTTAYSGDLVTVTPPAGGGTVTTTDVLGRGSQVQRFQAGTSGAARLTSLSYDPLGNLSGFSRGGQSWSYGYDQLGRRTRAVDPDTGSTSYTYDSSSNLTTTTSNGRLVTNTFDSYSRPLATFDGDAATGTVLNSTAYVSASPNLGAVASVSSLDSGAQFKTATTSWDQFNRPLNAVFTVPSGGLFPAELAGDYTRNFTYRTGGGLKTVNYAFNNTGGVADETVTSTVTNLGLPSTLSTTAAAPGSPAVPIITATGFDATGLPASRTWATGASGVGLARTFGFDQVRRIPTSVGTNATTGAGTATAVTSEAIGYDAVSRPTSITDSGAGQTRCFSYTGYSELSNAWTQAAASCPGAAPAVTSGTWNTGAGPFWASWVFDNDTGHVTNRVDGDPANTASPVNTGFAYEDAAHPNAVTDSIAEGGAGGFVLTGYQYDAGGQRTSRGDLGGAPDTEAITWTALHKPASVTTPAGDTKFAQNADGTRLIRATPTSTTVYLGDTELTVNASTRAVTARRAYSSGGSQVAFRDTSTGSANLVYTAADTQGSASLQVDPGSFTATTGWVSASYTPYGTQRLQTPDNQTWAGDHDWLNKPLDAATGLIQTDQRLYDPGLQQFISPDPLLNPLHPNPYTYANNNPIAGADPSGLWSFSAGGCLLGVCASVSVDTDHDGVSASGTVSGGGHTVSGSVHVSGSHGASASVSYTGHGHSGGAHASTSSDVFAYHKGLAHWATETFNGIGYAQTHPVETIKGLLDTCGGALTAAGSWGASCGAGMIIGYGGSVVDTYRQHGFMYTAGTVMPDIALTIATFGIGSGETVALRAETQAARAAARAGAKTAARTPENLLVPGGLKLSGVPRGATGVPTQTGKGLEYSIPKGTPELDPRVTSVRIMDPVTSGKYQYPNGYASYMNQGGQTVNPLTGQTILPSDPFSHIVLR